MKQEEYFGEGETERLAEILKRIKSKKIFLVTGKNSYEKSGAKERLKNLRSDYEVIQFNDFNENPKLNDVGKGVSLIKSEKCDTVVAIGGGSVIDMAKLINIFSGNDVEICSYTGDKISITQKGKPLIALPTTSGAGSEATHFAVLYNENKKYSVAHKYILPDIVIIDPELTYKLNPEQTAISGIDALSQAIESHWSVNSTEESKRFSSASIQLITKNLTVAVNNPTKVSRHEMSRAANLSGKAINITKTTAAHALSYSMTSYFGIPHGQAVSISLGEFLKYNYELTDADVTDSRGAEYVKKSINEIANLLGCSGINEAAERINLLMKQTGLKTRLSELGISSEDSIKIIIDNVNTERLQNNPRKLTGSGLEAIIRNIR